VTLIGPVWEELLFRGFLFPLLTKSVGPWLGIVLSAIPFALLHGAQNQWSWQYVLLIFLAGFVFGYTRHKTGSTAAAALVHAGYNFLYFAGFVLQRGF
jgi:membrane protease YdiL (CAAX protease family)